MTQRQQSSNIKTLETGWGTGALICTWYSENLKSDSRTCFKGSSDSWESTTPLEVGIELAQNPIWPLTLAAIGGDRGPGRPGNLYSSSTHSRNGPLHIWIAKIEGEILPADWVPPRIIDSEHILMLIGKEESLNWFGKLMTPLINTVHTRSEGASRICRSTPIQIVHTRDSKSPLHIQC